MGKLILISLLLGGIILTGCSNDKPIDNISGKKIEGCPNSDPLCLFTGDNKGKGVEGCPDNDPLCLFTGNTK